MNWAKGIILSFVLFIVFIGSMVFIMMKQDVSLVTNNYYQMELAYQNQLNRKNNALMLDKMPMVKVMDGRQMEIVFPYELKAEKIKVQLYRPVDEKLDEQHWFAVSKNNRLNFRLQHHLPGACRVRIWWQMGGREYYWHTIVVL